MVVEAELQRRERAGDPVRVGIVGAGYMGRGIARRLLRPLPGMRLAAVANRTLSNAVRSYEEAGAEPPRVCDTPVDLERAVESGTPAVTESPEVLCGAGSIDVVVEATGEVEFGARVALEAIGAGKHVVLMNAELDATVGPILKTYADSAGVVITNTDGDEPGVAMNLVRLVRTVGADPVCAGNIKGLIDHRRTPETQKAFAELHGQKPFLITSFADGTKLSMEATVLANATGFGVVERGMRGYECEHVRDLLDVFRPEDFAGGGRVEYTLGAAPHTGAFVIARDTDPLEHAYMRYFKMGDGPLYCFYTPFHLPHLQIATSIARAALFDDATVAPLGAPSCDVITMAKRPLRAGEVLDGIGGFLTYGAIENATESWQHRCLPMGLSEGCRVLRDLPMDHPLAYEDVAMPAERRIDRLRREQDDRFAPGAPDRVRPRSG